MPGAIIGRHDVLWAEAITSRPLETTESRIVTVVNRFIAFATAMDEQRSVGN